MARAKTPAAKSVARNLKLLLLRHDVEDERFLQIFADFAGLIRRSERACEKAQKTGNPDYADFVGESEADYLEEIIGASFIVLQTKIRRVQTAVAELAAFMPAQYGLMVIGLDRASVMALGGAYRHSSSSLIELIWAVGNYYKHRDEWPSEAWAESASGKRESGPLRQSRATRRMVEKVGIVQLSTGNMRCAYEFFGIDPYSKHERLAEHVQAWAKDVLAEAKRLIDEAHAKAAKKLSHAERN